MLHYASQVDLSQGNTLKLPCVAAHLLDLASAEDLLEAFQRYPESGTNFMLLGEGSNLILPPFLDCYVLRFHCQPAESVKVLSYHDDQQLHKDQQRCLVEVNAGVIWDEFVAYCVAQGWHGLENLSLIPGSVGAAPIQNIGAYGVEVADTLHEVHVFNVREQKLQILQASQCQFAYRDSIFKRCPGQYIIYKLVFCLATNAGFTLDYGELAALKERNNLSLADVRNCVVATRQAKLPDPRVLPNAGSFFKNPVVSAEKASELKRRFPGLVAYPQARGEVKLAAGWLIDQAGWKGFRNQSVGVHDRQALVLINHHQGSQADLLSLARDIQSSIKQRFDIVLEIEPVIIAAKSVPFSA